MTLRTVLRNGTVTSGMISLWQRFTCLNWNSAKKRGWICLVSFILVLGITFVAALNCRHHAEDADLTECWIYAAVTLLCFFAAFFLLIATCNGMSDCRKALRMFLADCKLLNELMKKYRAISPYVCFGFNTRLYAEWAQNLLVSLARGVICLEAHGFVASITPAHIGLRTEFHLVHEILVRFGLVNPEWKLYFAKARLNDDSFDVKLCPALAPAPAPAPTSAQPSSESASAPDDTPELVTATAKA
jgi:hypothetical protein